MGSFFNSWADGSIGPGVFCGRPAARSVFTRASQTPVVMRLLSRRPYGQELYIGPCLQRVTPDEIQNLSVPAFAPPY